ncbi:MAG: hypothetical protein ACEPO8_00545, partial [Rhodothermaceae bacterium]
MIKRSCFFRCIFMLSTLIMCFLTSIFAQNKINIYYPGENIASSSDGAKRAIVKRSFNHVMIPCVNNINGINNLKNDFSVIAMLNNIYDLRKGNPWDPTNGFKDYTDRLTAIQTFISNNGNDIEIGRAHV